jgi:hypothetical protein
MSVHEDRIRDKLSTRLDLIEASLSLIRVNYALPNSEGTRGFIDILAHDRHGVFVVIELKRNGKTAREAPDLRRFLCAGVKPTPAARLGCRPSRVPAPRRLRALFVWYSVEDPGFAEYPVHYDPAETP